ncbi:PAS domain S-box protein [Candidatus Neomarinimicrobiota bacterium]
MKRTTAVDSPGENEPKSAPGSSMKEQSLAQQYLDIAGVILIALNSKGEITLVNQKGSEVLQLREDEIVGKNWFDFFVPEPIRKDVKSVFFEIMSGELEPFENYENPVITKSGEERIIAWHNSLLRNADGEITGTLSSGEDITERIKAEEALRFSRFALEHSADAAFWLDPAFRIVYVNEAAGHLLGYSSDELLSMKIYDLAPDYPAEIWPGVWREIKQAGSIARETVQKAKDGSLIQIEMTAYFMEFGGCEYVCSYVRDISRRKKAELTFTKEHELLSAISGAQSQYIAETDTHTIFEGLLGSLLQLSDSEYGFIGEILETPEGQPYLKSYAITNIAWNDETRQFYDQHAPDNMEFFNLKTLFGTAITSGKAVIANDPEKDPRAGGLPEGHPPLRAFMGIPIISDSKMVGLCGIANRPNGYDDECLEYLRPLVETIANLVERHRAEVGRQMAEEALRQKTEDLTLINAINEAKNKGSSLQEIIQLLSRETARIFSSYGASVYLIDDQQQLLTLQHLPLDTPVVGKLMKLLNIDLPSIMLPLEEDTWASEVLANNRAHLATSSEDINRWINDHIQMAQLMGAKLSSTVEKLTPQIAGILKISSMMLAPLSSGDQIFGLLTIARAGKEPFTETDLERFETIAQQVTSAINRRRAIEALRDREQRIRLLMDSTAEAIYGCDTEGNCIFANPACLRLLGYDRLEDILGRNMHELIHYAREDGSLLPVEECSMCQIYVPGEQGHSENEVMWRANGICFPVEYWSHPIIRDNKATGAVVTFLDISKRKQTQDQLAQSAKLSALGQMAAGIAHEINNPLGNILGYTHLLLEEHDLGDEIRKDLQRIEDRAVHTREIVQNVLTFARRSPLKLQASNINRLVEESIVQLGAESRRLGVAIQSALDANLPEIQVDPPQIQQVFINLIRNGIQSMTEGGKLKVKTRLNDDDHTILIDFLDTGPGIPAESLKQIFDPFFTTKEVGAGTGLGLSISYGLVEAHGGTIGVESQVGVGSKFTVTLPLPQ